MLEEKISLCLRELGHCCFKELLSTVLYFYGKDWDEISFSRVQFYCCGGVTNLTLSLRPHHELRNAPQP